MTDPVLPADLCHRLLSAALARGGDWADVYAERGVSRSLSYEEGRLKRADESVSLGVGIRVVQGERTGYASTEGLAESDLLAAAARAAAIATGSAAAPAALRTAPIADRYRAAQPVSGADLATRLALLRRAHDRAAGQAKVFWVSVSMVDADQSVTIAGSDGTFVTDRRPMVRCNVSVQAKDGGRRESGYDGGGGRQGLDYFLRRSPEAMADEAVRKAVLLFDARPAPAGPMPIVLAPAASGILIHEAVGHGLEADFNRKGVSAYSGKVGQQVASDLVTVLDGPDHPGDRGSLNVDDEGVTGTSTTLIERGILRGYINDRLSARLMGVAPTGNGRRESYRSVPIPRMTVTWLAAGSDDPADIVRSVQRGLYCAGFGGGSVDITKGDFNFHVTEGYLIEDGRITAPVKGATLIGNGPEAMRRVAKVGHDLRFSDGSWTCGKDGQGAPVGQGLPTTLVSELVVGGRSG